MKNAELLNYRQPIQHPTGKTSFSYGEIINALEERLADLLPGAEEAPEPLHRAMRHAVLSGGKRLRPHLLIAVVTACAGDTLKPVEIDLALNAACAVEYIHAASLVHDDLPSFDDARERRGRATVHVLYGEPLAILAGDALLSRAFTILAEAPPDLAHRALGILRLMGAAVGSREGIIGGQSLESSGPVAAAVAGRYCDPAQLPPDVVDRYHAMKSAALFRLAAAAGAAVMGHPEQKAWGELGSYLGRALQLADDLLDTYGHATAADKPVGRDAMLGRPNAVLINGEALVRARMWALLEQAQRLAMSLATDPRLVISFLNEASVYFSAVASGARASGKPLLSGGTESC